MKMRIITGTGIAAVMLSSSVAAHHSFAMFDKTREIELKNVTVKEWQWTSPHTWLFVVAADGTKWSIEGGNPGVMRREGFAKGSLAAGDKITVYIAPLKSGLKGGSINAVIPHSGKMLGERMKP